MTTVNYNERSWAIDLISDINSWLTTRNIVIKRAGGELTLQSGKESLFPDVLLFGDNEKGLVLQGWELKMPDTPLTNTEYIDNAKVKAKLLSLNSFLLWNVSRAVLYRIEDDDSLVVLKTWNNLAHITAREEVKSHHREILDMLDEIMTDINNFISSGTVKKTPVTNAVNSGIIAQVIQANTPACARVLEDAAVKSSGFNSEMTLWWRYAKNDYPEEINKYVVAARNNLLSIINKFIFAHILKSYHADAGIIDSITPSTDVQSAIHIFNNLTAQCDFWNIFTPQFGEELIPLAAWQDIVNLHSLLREFNFAVINQSLIHDMLGNIILANKRKFAGQYATPPDLARFIVGLTVQDPAAHVVDPCCGTGTIATEMYRLKKKSSGPEQALATLWASDKFSLPLQMAAINVAEPEAIGYPIKIFKADATKLVSGQDITVHQPFSGESYTEQLPKFGYIISNLPFVQQEDLEELNPGVFEINTFIRGHVGEDFQLDPRSDLYAYLPFYFWKLLNSGGTLAIIVSNSWLGTAWGERYFRALSHFYRLTSVITSGNGRWFANAKVVTNVITMVRRDEPAAPVTDENMHFVVTKKSMSRYDSTAIGEIKALLTTDRTVDEDDISINTCAMEVVDKVLNLGPNLNSFFADNKWLPEIETQLIPVAKLFDISRGERRGWDQLFYPQENAGIEEEYLKPVLRTPRSLTGLIAKPDGIAFCCNRSISELERLGHTGALSWIRRFQGMTNTKGKVLTEALARKNTHWYTMLPETKGEIVTSINFGDRLFFSRFIEPTFVNQRLVTFRPKDPLCDIRLCHALMNSLIGLFYIEAMGTGRGEGALDLSKNKFENSMRILNPALVSQDDKDKILSLFEKLESRKVLPILQELDQPDRNVFDDAVLSTFNQNSYKEKIKNALVTLYKIRATVNTSNRS